MKKSLSAILVLLLSLIGAKAFASKIDLNVNSRAIQTNDKTGTENEKTGGACRSKIGQ